MPACEVSCPRDRGSIRSRGLYLIVVARLITFGGLSARNGTVINGVANPRSRLAILAVLAVAGDRGIRREKLAAMFWPDSGEERARSALRQALFTLKRDIGGGEITLGVTDLRLNPEVLTADVSDFDAAMREERFGDAALLYRGPFLDGVFLRESPEFERWVEEQRARLSSEFGRAVERAATQASERGDLHGAVSWWEKRARHDPLSGRVARIYMEALVAAGDRERAIRHAAVYSQLVRKELEAEPDPEVLSLAERLREASRGQRVAGGTENPADRSPVASPGFETTTVAPNATPDPADRGRPIRAIKRGTLIGIPIVGLALVVYLMRDAAPAPIDSRTVAVTLFANQTGDSALAVVGQVIRHEISTGLTESRLADVVESEAADSIVNELRGSLKSRMRSASPRWRYVISGRYAVSRESLFVHAELWEASRGTVFRTVAVSSGRQAEASEIGQSVRSSVLAAIAPRLDPWLSDWSETFTQPSRFDAYDRFAQGMRKPEQDTSKLTLLREAAQLDPGFHLASLWLPFFEQQKPIRDSILQQLGLRRAGMTEIERAILDYHVAANADRRQRFLVAKRLTSLAPRSDWWQWVYANDAATLGRSGDALQALQRMDTAGPWMTVVGDASFWTFTAQLHHTLGQFPDALDAVRRARTYRPDLAILRQRELRELAALGRLGEVDEMLAGVDQWSRSTLDGSTLAVPFAIAVEEFSTHGHLGHARAVSERLDSILMLLPDSLQDKPRMLNVRARVLIALGRPDRALAVLNRRAGDWGWEALGWKALATAASGQAESADSALSAMMEKSVHLQRMATRSRAAQVYALLGDRRRAMANLRQALLEGAGWLPLQHDRPAADSLKRYPTAEALLRDASLVPR